MSQRRFNHFYIELCCAQDRRIARYALWLELCDRGLTPEKLDREGLLFFFDTHLDAYLAHGGTPLTPRSRRRLRRALERYNPRFATPDEFMERIAAPQTT